MPSTNTARLIVAKKYGRGGEADNEKGFVRKSLPYAAGAGVLAAGGYGLRNPEARAKALEFIKKLRKKRLSPSGPDFPEPPDIPGFAKGGEVEEKKGRALPFAAGVAAGGAGTYGLTRYGLSRASTPRSAEEAKSIAAGIVSKLKNKFPKKLAEGGEVDDGMMSAAEDLISAIHSKDAKGVASALQAAFDLCGSSSKEEGEE